MNALFNLSGTASIVWDFNSHPQCLGQAPTVECLETHQEPWAGTLVIATAGDSDGVYSGPGLTLFSFSSNEPTSDLTIVPGPPSVIVAGGQVTSISFREAGANGSFLSISGLSAALGLNEYRQDHVTASGTLVDPPPASPIPEPEIFGLMALGLIAIAIKGRIH